MKRSFLRSSLYLLLFSAILTVVTESLNTKTVVGGILFPAQHPFSYLINVFLLWMLFSLCLLVRRRAFVFGCVLLLTMGLSVTNCVVQLFRTTPLAAIDFSILRSMFKVLPIYMKLWQIIGIVVALIGCVSMLVYVFCRCERHPRRILPAIVCVLIPVICFGIGYGIGKRSGLLPERISALAEDYRTYGFPYSFTMSLLDRGIDRPESYSEAEMDEITEKLESVQSEDDETVMTASPDAAQPNVIVLQLESFIDVGRMTGYAFSEDPTPCFRRFKEMCYTGYLTVPSIGGGTANTEFEVLTGMCLEFFGAGEYPYQTCLQDKTCESMAYLLRETGYTTHAIHNNTATFYDRIHVYPHLGFDTFTPMEYMENVTYNELGWAEDRVLIDAVTDALNSTSGADFVFAVSVQPHGRYPTDRTPDNDTIGIIAPDPLTPEDESELSYYIGQIHAVDMFLADLIDTLKSRDEDTLLVVYGDHFPSLACIEACFPDNELFQTEYVIWDSRSAEIPETERREDISAYQLSAKIFGLLGIDNGIMPKLHRGYHHTAQYPTMLEMVEYDLLYGEQILYNRENPYPMTSMRCGVRENAYSVQETEDGSLLITGEGNSIVNAWTVVFCNGWPCDTIWNGDKTLTVPSKEVPEVCIDVTVTQMADDGTVLGETAAAFR